MFSELSRVYKGEHWEEEGRISSASTVNLVLILKKKRAPISK